VSVRMTVMVTAQWALPHTIAPSGSDQGLGFVGALWTHQTLVPMPQHAPFMLRSVRGGPLPQKWQDAPEEDM
jgi:hypothetical protein